MRKETIAIRGQIERSQYSEHSAPLYLTSSYIFEDAEDMRSQFAEEKPGEIYSRYANPNVQELLDKVALLEGGESAWATASGMAAVFTTFATFLSAGDEIVSSRSVFGSTHRLLVDVFPKWNIKNTYVDFNNYSAYESAITDKTKLVYIETPSNPALDLIDIERLAAICKSRGVLLVVDNCFATPILQQPIKWGADLVIHSTTKFMDGQGRTLGGLIVSSKELIEKVKAFARHSGPAMSPFNAWVISKSIETLDVRMERHCKNALEIAKRLSTLSGISWVKYPFLSSHPDYEIAKKQMSDGGGLVSFELAGGLESGRQFLNKLNLFSLTANLGDTRSIATHPASTTHSKLSPEQRHEVGISDGLIRLSIGLENIEDIWEDIFQACQA
ncbi:MAG: trans-sulfuration enzyme family protein [Bacteroidota bacterium]